MRICYGRPRAGDSGLTVSLLLDPVLTPAQNQRAQRHALALRFSLDTDPERRRDLVHGERDALLARSWKFVGVAALFGRRHDPAIILPALGFRNYRLRFAEWALRPVCLLWISEPASVTHRAIVSGFRDGLKRGEQVRRGGDQSGVGCVLVTRQTRANVRRAGRGNGVETYLRDGHSVELVQFPRPWCVGAISIPIPIRSGADAAFIGHLFDPSDASAGVSGCSGTACTDTLTIHVLCQARTYLQLPDAVDRHVRIRESRPRATHSLRPLLVGMGSY